MGTDVLIAEAWPGDPMGGNQKKIWGRGRGRDRGRQPVIIDDLNPEEAEELFQFLLRDLAKEGLPTLARWCNWHDYYHRGGELETIASELQQALEAAEAGSATARMLEKLLALTRRAHAEQLILVVLAD